MRWPRSDSRCRAARRRARTKVERRRWESCWRSSASGVQRWAGNRAAPRLKRLRRRVAAQDTVCYSLSAPVVTALSPTPAEPWALDEAQDQYADVVIGAFAHSGIRQLLACLLRISMALQRFPRELHGLRQGGGGAGEAKAHVLGHGAHKRDDTLTAPHAHLLAAHHIPQPVTRHDHKLVVIVQNFLAQVRFRNNATPLDPRGRKGGAAGFNTRWVGRDSQRCRVSQQATGRCTAAKQQRRQLQTQQQQCLRLALAPSGSDLHPNHRRIAPR